MDADRQARRAPKARAGVAESMVSFFSNTTTVRLEGFARARGLDLGIVVSEGNSAGRFFVTRNGNDVLTHWTSLGWTRDDAERDILERVECERYYAQNPALCGACGGPPHKGICVDRDGYVLPEFAGRQVGL